MLLRLVLTVFHKVMIKAMPLMMPKTEKTPDINKTHNLPQELPKTQENIGACQVIWTSVTERLGRQPNASYCSEGDSPLPVSAATLRLVANIVKEVNDS